MASWDNTGSWSSGGSFGGLNWGSNATGYKSSPSRQSWYDGASKGNEGNVYVEGMTSLFGDNPTFSGRYMTNSGDPNGQSGGWMTQDALSSLLTSLGYTGGDTGNGVIDFGKLPKDPNDNTIGGGNRYVPEYPYGSTNMEEWTKYFGDILNPLLRDAVGGIDAQWDLYGKQQGLFDDFISKENARNEQSASMNREIEQALAQLQGYMPAIDSAYNDMAGYMPELRRLMGLAESAYGDVGNAYGKADSAYDDLLGDMDAVRQAYQWILSGQLPEATEAKITDKYNLQMENLNNEINKLLSNSTGNILDNLGARGILNGTTSQGMITGLNSSAQEQLRTGQNLYGQAMIDALLEESYKIFGAATQMHDSGTNTFNSALGLTDAALGKSNAAQGLVNSGLGVHNAYGNTLQGAINRYGAANTGVNTLLNSVGTRAALGQSSIDNILNGITSLGNMANIPSNIFNQGAGAASNLFQSLLGAETARMTSGNASGGSSGGSTWDNIGSIIGGIGSLF